MARFVTTDPANDQVLTVTAEANTDKIHCIAGHRKKWATRRGLLWLCRTPVHRDFNLATSRFVIWIVPQAKSCLTRPSGLASPSEEPRDFDGFREAYIRLVISYKDFCRKIERLHCGLMRAILYGLQLCRCPDQSL